MATFDLDQLVRFTVWPHGTGILAQISKKVRNKQPRARTSNAVEGNELQTTAGRLKMQIWKEVTSCSLGVKDKAKDVCVIYFIPGYGRTG